MAVSCRENFTIIAEGLREVPRHPVIPQFAFDRKRGTDIDADLLFPCASILLTVSIGFMSPSTLKADYSASGLFGII
jgi:hypothetical protein